MVRPRHGSIHPPQPRGTCELSLATIVRGNGELIVAIQDLWPKLLSRRPLARPPLCQKLSVQPVAQMPFKTRKPRKRQVSKRPASRQVKDKKARYERCRRRRWGLVKKACEYSALFGAEVYLLVKDEHNAHYFSSEDRWISAPQDVVSQTVLSSTASLMLMVNGREPCASKHLAARSQRLRMTCHSPRPVLMSPSTPFLSALPILFSSVLPAPPPSDETCGASTQGLSTV